MFCVVYNELIISIIYLSKLSHSSSKDTLTVMLHSDYMLSIGLCVSDRAGAILILASSLVTLLVALFMYTQHPEFLSGRQ